MSSADELREYMIYIAQLLWQGDYSPKSLADCLWVKAVNLPITNIKAKVTWRSANIQHKKAFDEALSEMVAEAQKLNLYD